MQMDLKILGLHCHLSPNHVCLVIDVGRESYTVKEFLDVHTGDEELS